MFHVGAATGTGTPIFDPAELEEDVLGEKRNMLVDSIKLGAALANKFGTGLQRSDILPEAEHAVVLMRGHGLTVVGTSIQQAVFRTIVTRDNAAVLKDVLAMGLAKDLVFLTEREACDAAAANDRQIHRPWGLWLRQIDTAGFGYQNSLRKVIFSICFL